MKCFVIGNGSSLIPELLDKIDAPSFGVNRIWKMFPFTDWRPTYYVRAEVPAYNAEHVQEDLKEMGRQGVVMYLQDGFRGLEPRNPHPQTRFEYFKTCDGSRHDWHLPLICGYGTVVHVAMQLAVTLGYDEIELLGCDMQPTHFYKDEPFTNADLALDAHRIAARCCGVKVTYEKEEVYRTAA
jgi:hypothetical protein